MKKILIAMLAFCSMLTFSCKKDNHNPADNLFIGATKQGSSWLVQQPGTMFTANKDSLVIHGVKGEEGITIRIPFKGVGTYQITGDQALYYTTVGGDVITSRYIPDATKVNTVTITSSNIYTGIVKGNFELNLKKTEGGATLDNAVTLTNGKLWVETPPIN